AEPDGSERVPVWSFLLVDDGIRVCGQAHLLGGVVVADWDQPALTAHSMLLLLSFFRTKKDRNCLRRQLRSSWSCCVLVFLVGFADWIRRRLRPRPPCRPP